MTIPVFIVFGWVALIAFGAWAGITMHIIASYPKKPTVRGWLIWTLLAYSAEALIYATWRGWVYWA